MEAPVSAFAMYNSNKQSNKNKKQKKKAKKTLKAVNDLREDVLKELSRKVKKKQKKSKLSKDISKIKKKTHKKKKKTRQATGDTEKTKPVVAVSKNSESDDIPELVPTYVNHDSKISQLNGEPSEEEVYHLNSTLEFTPIQTDSSEEGLKIFKWMIAPYNPKDFLNAIWEKKPLHIARQKPKYYNSIISTPAIDGMLRNENIQFTKNLDVTSYINGNRETHNPEGRALPHIVWDYYLNGCSLRLLNPQTYIHRLHLLNATLQEFFNSFVGANAYLTPPDSQGFAPHYDDIEAFILQAEGKKLWKIYKPREQNETLPRVSSKNFTDDEIGSPIMEVMLEAGDMLYFPRGYIHQGVTIDGEHSLHVTVSMYQKHSWADLFEKMIPAALDTAINENVDFRRGLPFDIYNEFGLVHSDTDNPRKNEIRKIIHTLLDKIKDHLPIDEAVDQMAKNYQRDALPPVLSNLEKEVTVYGDCDLMIEGGRVINRVELGLDTNIRLLRKNILRMVSEDTIKLYYYSENSLEYHGNELPFLEIDEDMAPAVETLIKTYPQYVAVEDLDNPNESDKLQLADALWSRGLLMTEYPMEDIID